jgi:hypothetical protein
LHIQRTVTLIKQLLHLYKESYREMQKFTMYEACTTETVVLLWQCVHLCTETAEPDGQLDE